MKLFGLCIVATLFGGGVAAQEPWLPTLRRSVRLRMNQTGDTRSAG